MLKDGLVCSWQTAAIMLLACLLGSLSSQQSPCCFARYIVCSRILHLHANLVLSATWEMFAFPVSISLLLQFPSFHKLSFVSLLAAVMSIGYSTIAIGIASHAGMPCIRSQQLSWCAHKGLSTVVSNYHVWTSCAEQPWWFWLIDDVLGFQQKNNEAQTFCILCAGRQPGAVYNLDGFSSAEAAWGGVILSMPVLFIVICQM